MEGWGCQAPEKAPAGSLQDRGGRIPNPIGEKAGCFSLLPLAISAGRRNSLCLTLQECRGIQGGVLWGNDLRLARSWAFAWEETAMAFVSNTACVHKESQKQNICFSFPLPPFWLHWRKWAASGLNQWRQEEKSTRNSSCWKPQYCRYRATDSVYHQLSVLTVDIHSGQSGDLVPQSLCLCWLTESDVQSWALEFPKAVEVMQCGRNAAASLRVSYSLSSEKQNGHSFLSHLIPLRCSKRHWFLAAVKWDQKLNQVSKV